MGEQMTREQIEAWLALEGWQFHPDDLRFVTHAWKETGGAYVSELVSISRGVRYFTGGNYDRDGRRSDISRATTEELQLIYQEIIKHEKD